MLFNDPSENQYNETRTVRVKAETITQALKENAEPDSDNRVISIKFPIHEPCKGIGTVQHSYENVDSVTKKDGRVVTNPTEFVQDDTEWIHPPHRYEVAQHLDTDADAQQVTEQHAKAVERWKHAVFQNLVEEIDIPEQGTFEVHYPDLEN